MKRGLLDYLLLQMFAHTSVLRLLSQKVGKLSKSTGPKTDEAPKQSLKLFRISKSANVCLCSTAALPACVED